VFKIHIIAPVIMYECKTDAFFAISCYLKFFGQHKLLTCLSTVILYVTSPFVYRISCIHFYLLTVTHNNVTVQSCSFKVFYIFVLG